MITAIDTNVLLDILTADPDHLAKSRALLESACQEGEVVFGEVVFAELAAFFESPGRLVAFMADAGITYRPSDWRALFEAGQAWRLYARQRGNVVRCVHCGDLVHARCDACGSRVTWRQHIIADFLVGAHAIALTDGLLTRDRGYYRRYFPSLRLVQ